MAVSTAAPATWHLTSSSFSYTSSKASNLSWALRSQSPPSHRRRCCFTSSKPRTTIPLVQAKKQTFSSLDELLEKAEKPVLVDFYATWCGPCQFMAPILNEVSITMGDTIQVVKIDTEKYPEIANKYNIEALPTFILFKDGKPFDRFEGALTANQLIQRIEGILKVEN
ncbi:uncharacterized protein [Rutidosis leptorrhynchoides]|uniref:uncharacterized protein n=1 Tax=Rutidosis leptorrhynchoides TaxID=125765 RepID=UPI003A99E863